MIARLVGVTMALAGVMGAATLAQNVPAPAPEQIRAAAFDVMTAARYCTLVTVGADGHPQAPIVDPLIDAAGGSIWIATNPLSRKVSEIERDARVTLSFFNAPANEYVTVLASRLEVSSPRHKLNNDAQTWRPVILDLAP